MCKKSKVSTLIELEQPFKSKIVIYRRQNRPFILYENKEER